MDIHRGSLERGVKRQWVNRKRRFSGLSYAISSAPYGMRPTLLYSIIQSLVAFQLIPKHVTLRDLEILNGHFTLNFHGTAFQQ